METIFILLFIGFIILLYFLIEKRKADRLKKSSFKHIDKRKKIQDNIKFDDRYKIKNSLPSTMNVTPGGPKLYKRDMTGLMAYFSEMDNMKRIFDQFTHAIRNGVSEEEFIKNITSDDEVRSVLEIGFTDISSFLKDILKIEENSEMRKDYNSTLKAIKILKSYKKTGEKIIKIDEEELVDIGIVSHYKEKPFTGIATAKLEDGFNLETNFKNGLKHGDQFCYYEDGTTFFIKEYKDDKYISTKEFDLKNGMNFEELKSYVCMHYISEIIEADGKISDRERLTLEQLYTTVLSKEKIKKIDNYIKSNKNFFEKKDKIYFIDRLLNTFSREDFMKIFGLTVAAMAVDGKIDDKELKVLYELGNKFRMGKDDVDEFTKITLDSIKIK